MRSRLLPFLPSLLLFTVPVRAEIIERVVVKVNGEIVTLTDFQGRQLRALQQARVVPEQVPTYLRENNARLLQEAIDDLVLKQRAEEQGLRIPPQYIADAIEEIKKDNNITNDERFLEMLSREGMTLEDLKQDIERPMLREGVVRRDLEARVTPTDADARAEYEKNKEKYSRPATVTLHEILLKGDDAERNARALAERARKGEDFATLARDNSAAATKAKGGELGKITRGELNPDFEKVAFALPVNGISEPVRASDGWRVFKVSEKTEAGALEFDAAKDEIKRGLQVERFAKEYEAYMADLRKNAVIDIRVREVPLQIDETGRLVDAPLLSGSPSSPVLGAPARTSPNAPPEDEISTSGSPKPAPTPPVTPPNAPPDDEITTSGAAKPEKVGPPR